MNKSIKITSPHSTQRDIQLDIYRALIMIYILCIIHVSFWLGAISEPMKSIILFEMPVIFYISGAALNVSNKRKSLSSTFVNRAKRVLAPYYAYAFFCIIIAIGYYFIGNENPKPIQSTILNALIPKDNSVPIPYTYHLWFVIPYFVISCSFYFQQIITDRINPYTYLYCY